ncbi:MAG: oxygen-independent coproporphyrinogen III oxidase [Gammaproteobacteria bacterium]|nr:oxygen-independent coproporphyrinogen III oxidase [Gammaproteobacteria bacterium]
MEQRVKFNTELIKRYDIAGPRYTSYPTAVQFMEGFDTEAYQRFIRASNSELIPKPLSLYVHLPFCRSLCYYCGCMKKVTRHEHQGDRYLELLNREIELQGKLFDHDREVIQLHFGGGTPTFHNDEKLSRLMAQLEENFSLSTDQTREFSIEVDPRTVGLERLAKLAEMGFNRISLGVQDIDPKVQEAVNRIQDPEATLEMVDGSRNLGFNSVSIDLIYGLPLQTVESFGQTIDTVVNARPDRLAVYNYAHLPHIFRAQRMIDSKDIPSPETKLELMELTIEKLTQSGYVYIGMDHFALPDDELTLAQREGGLQRNFQGYSTRRECDMVGLGVSAIGKVGDCYAQNLKDIPTWQSVVAEGKLPIWRGVSLNTEDRLRRSVIESIMCHGEVKFQQFESNFAIDFHDHFAFELGNLQQLEKDGLIEMGDDEFKATPEGRLLLRPIAMIFDEYLQAPESKPKFSRVI